MSWHSPSTIRAALDLLEQGYGSHRAAATLGVGQSTVRQWRDKHRRDPSWPPPATPCQSDQHDTRTAYRRGCRCPLAKDAEAAYQRGRYNDKVLGKPGRQVDATGSRRRLQGLALMGWDRHSIAPIAGLAAEHLGRIICGQYETVLRSTADAVERAARELVRRGQGPSTRARRHAVRQGYVPLLAWDDIDNPREKPTGHVVEMRPRRLPNGDDLAALVNELGVRLVAERYDVSRSAVQAALARSGYVAGRTGQHRPIYRKQEAA